MPMRDDFCAFILTHGRPDRVRTYSTLQRSGYTGKVYIVIDDEDETADEYRKRFGDKILLFCREDAFKATDDGDNFGKSKGVVYARNVCWDLARQIGVRYFIMLDDDYVHFNIRFRSDGSTCTCMIRTRMNDVMEALVAFYESVPAVTIAMSQGGDFIGGGTPDKRRLSRKAMNTFFCSVDRQFEFVGHINEDVNAYVIGSRRGELFFTVMQAFVNQPDTQSVGGGLTEFYLDVGTYVKSFYSVMYAPSCVTISQMGDSRSPRYRIHHKINWHHCAPKILREGYRKTRNGSMQLSAGLKPNLSARQPAEVAGV